MALKRPKGEALADLVFARTGHAFRDLALLQTALTHSSARRAADDNERLEFLGDRVLALVISEMLFSAFPDAPEGELAPRLNALVRGTTCAEIGLEIGLGEMIRAEAAVRPRGGVASNVLADAVEALIAAIYLEGGLEAARRFILRYWEGRSRSIVAAPLDPKNALQEWAAQTVKARPVYTVETREGPDHEPVFTVLVEIEGFGPARAKGRSKQSAERAAALAFLQSQGVAAAEEPSPHG